jgi:hypothetical protein
MLILCFFGIIFRISCQAGSAVVENTYTFTTNYIWEMPEAYPGVNEYIVWGDVGENKNQSEIAANFPLLRPVCRWQNSFYFAPIYLYYR